MEARTVEASHGWTWVAGGFRLLLKQPRMWLAVLFVLFVVAKILVLIPVLGGIVFALLIPVFLARLMLIDTATGRSKEIFSAPRQAINGPALSANAREIYVNINQIQSDIVLAKLSTGATPRTP